MLKRLLIAGGLALCCLSCAPTIRGVPGQPPFAADLEPYEEAVDKGCAYFHYLWGKSAELEDHYDEAIYAYKQALVCDRLAGHVMRSLATLLVKTGRQEEAVEWVNKLIDLNPKDIEARALLANLYSIMERFDEAIGMYQSILAEDPQNFNVRLLLGSLYARLRDYEKAQVVLEKLTELNPDSYAGFYYLAKLYQEMRLFDKASEAFEKALALNWSPMLAQEAAELYVQEKQYSQAIAIYNRILAEDPSDERARSFLANVYFRQGEIAKALTEMEKLREISANPDKVELAICRILLDADRRSEGVTRLKALLKRDPHSDAARALLTLAYYQQGDLAATKKLLRQVGPPSPAYEESVLMLARILQQEKDFPGAEKALQQAMADKQHRRLNFYVALAMLYAGEDKIAKAHGVFTQAFVDFPDTVEVHYEYALFLHKLDDMAGSMREMEEVLKLDPQHARALNYVGYTWAEEGRNLEKAKAYIEQAVAQLPKDGFVRDSLGWVYYQLGDFSAAVRELEQAVALSPDDPTIYEHLGDAYLKNSDRSKARKAYEKSLALHEEEEKKEVVRRKLESFSSGDERPGGAQ
ncbi:tetratricopeptide repeat protein [Thiovibrio frasassiensis]|uniref:Tetratricopeptide repeat protein n=1 Tax=Thiovibrio frasassiensis TaxID=2984131 RepID=A0A9X4MI12_9BACT|nr:tetratricopeptide repeat protein [Thiovibrio frasassiensis]MDG4476997.1 tetratricopeptide repeat protein [Thiovibrio frasassiensis]